MKLSLTEPQFVEMPDASYFEIHDWLGSSDVKMLYENPAKYWAEKNAPRWYHESNTSAAMEFGTNLHAALLTPDDFFPRLRVFKHFDNFALKEAKDHVKEMREKHGEHCIYMRHEHHFYLNEMIKSARAVPQIKRALEAPGRTEIAGFWRDKNTGTQCKLKLDKDLPELGWMLDVKTMAQINPRAVQKQVVDYLFPVQAAHYMDGGNAILGAGAYESFVFLCLEKVPPFTAALYVPDDDFMRFGMQARAKALQAYENSRENKACKNIQSGIFDLSLPSWVNLKENAE